MVIPATMTEPAAHILPLDRGILYRVLPFALFMGWIGLEECLRFVALRHGTPLPESAMQYLYAGRALSAGTALYLFRDRFPELRLRDLLELKTTALCAGAGVVTFLLWISVPAALQSPSPPAGFDPALFPEGATRALMVAVRVAGAVAVVPVMEELFWRSFLLRYLVSADFDSVPLGSFTWASFLCTSLLFGLEHHLILSGILAGALYNLILYRTRSLAQCVLAHAVTNLALALYVLETGRWQFW